MFIVICIIQIPVCVRFSLEKQLCICIEIIHPSCMDDTSFVMKIQLMKVQVQCLLR